MEFRLTLTHGDAVGALTRRAVRHALSTWHLTDPDGDVLLVATELAENVVRHTDDGGELRLALAPGALMIEVTDTSPELPTVRDPEPGSATGRGLQLVQTLARQWGTRLLPRGKVVWAEILVPPQLALVTPT